MNFLKILILLMFGTVGFIHSQTLKVKDSKQSIRLNKKKHLCVRLCNTDAKSIFQLKKVCDSLNLNVIRLHDYDYFVLEKKDGNFFNSYSLELKALRLMPDVCAAGVPYVNIHTKYVSNKNDMVSARKMVKIKEKGIYITSNVILTENKVPKKLEKKYRIKLQSCVGKKDTKCTYEADSSIGWAIFRLNKRIPNSFTRWEQDRLITKEIIRGKEKINPSR